MPDERRHAGRENLDLGHVARYDDKEDAGAENEVQLLVELGFGAESEVVDMGAGTGQFAIAASAACRRVVAVDISPVMLERLRAKAARAARSNVEIVNAGFLTYRHQRNPPQFVYSRWALHHLPDGWKVMALRRMRQMLPVGGVLRLSDIVFSFEPSAMEERLEAWCRSLPAEADANGEWVRADIEEHIRDEHSTFSWLLEPMIERVGFRIERAVRSDDGFFAEYIARAI